MKINRPKLIKRIVLILLLVGVVGIYFANRFVKNYGYDNLFDLWKVYQHNKNLAEKVTPEKLEILIDDKDYDFLSKRRDIALERGIQINDGEDNYVPCKIVHNGDTTKGEIRLKGHMTDHLQGEKWSFRVKTKKNPVMNMTRFSLQAPGTRNYAYEWVYHQLLKNEDVINLNYDFINVKLNDKDLGIYAVEEHFGQHVLEHNNRPKGAILRWNPELYWKWRIDELQGTFINEQYSNFSSSFAEPYEKGTVEDDSTLIQTYLKGSVLLEEFRRGEKKVSEVFDVERMASFHAIIDLVGGQHSLDWSDVKFYYNSATNKVEPVGYESFSVRKTESIAGQRIFQKYDQPELNYHNLLFSDPVFFEAYIKALERIADEKYFKEFSSSIQEELDKKIGVLSHEFAYRKFTFDPYYTNIELIRNNLQLPKPFHAFTNLITDSSVVVSVTPVSDFPIEILSLTIDGKEMLKLDSTFVLPAKRRDTYAHYFDLNFSHDLKKIKKLKLKARIPGSRNIFETAVSDLPAPNKLNPDYFAENSLALKDIGAMNVNDSVFFFNQKKIVIDKDVIIESGQTLAFFSGQEIEINSGATIFCEGKIEFNGGVEEDEVIIIRRPNYQGDKFAIVLNDGEISALNVEFFATDNFIKSNESYLNFRQCKMADIGKAFCVSSHDEIYFKDCAMGKVHSFIELNHSELELIDFFAENGTAFLNAVGSDIDIIRGKINNYTNFAVLNYNSALYAWQTNIQNSELLVSLNHASELRFFGGTISNVDLAVRVDQETNLPGNSFYEFYRTQLADVEKMEMK